MAHTTVFIIMDAGRADYIRPDSMPFLCGLRKQGLSGNVLSPPGFAQRTVLFSGRYPDTSGNFTAFTFDPDNSPFRWVRWLGPARRLIRPRRAVYPARKFIEKTTQWITGAHHADPAWIPPQSLPWFRPSEDMQPVHEQSALGAPSIFDLCRAYGKRYRYLAHPTEANDDEVHATLVRDLRSGAPYDFYVAQFRTIDRRGHVEGPITEVAAKRHLRELDDKLATIHAALTAGYDSWDLLICGDHGMSPIRRQVNLPKLLKKSDAKPGKDYVVFINSTFAVFWYLTEKGRDRISSLLPTIHGTQPLTDKQRRDLRIPTERRWGDVILAADPGVLFWPDYFHVRDYPVQGMHGYIDRSGEGPGALVLASSRTREAQDLGQRHLVDIFPTLCQLLGVPVPDTNEGSSLLSRDLPIAGQTPQGPARPVSAPQVVA